MTIELVLIMKQTENGIGEKVGRRIGEALKINRSLTSLNLRRDFKIEKKGL